jgi:hypothetical protein
VRWPLLRAGEKWHSTEGMGAETGIALGDP